jgi:VWFA-related protein
MCFDGKLTGTVAVFVTLVFIHSLVAEKKAKDDPQITFTAQTQLVLIPTLVTDKSGVHVAGLTKEDFTVLENGLERQIATFEEINTDTRRSPRLGNANEFSNFVAGDGSGRITLIVLDFINTPFLAQTNARKELLKYLTQSMEQREPVALYTLSRNGIRIIHDFATDPRVLIAALRKVKGDASKTVDSPEDVESITGTASPDGSAGIDPGAVQSETGKIQAMLEDRELNFQSFQQRLAITYTLEGLQQLAQSVAGFPGRKSLIWAGGGFPFSVSDNTMQLAPAGRDSLSDVLPMYEHTWQLLNASQIALYPVDVNELQVTGVPDASIHRPGVNYSRNIAWKQMDTQSTMETFASMTGGRAYYNSNDLVKGFRDAVRDSAQYYMLGYYLRNSNAKPGWHKLAVKVKRKHVELRSRSGFFVTNTVAESESSRNNDIARALQSPLDYSSIPVIGRWGKIEPGTNPGKKRVNYELELSADPSLVSATDGNHMMLEFVVLAKTPEGKTIGPPTGKRIDTHLSPEKVAAIGNHGLHYTGALDLVPGEYLVRFVVRDDLNGRIGSVGAPLSVD